MVATTAYETEGLIAKELANNTDFVQYCNDLIGENLFIVTNDDDLLENPKADIPCAIFSINQQSSDCDIHQQSLKFTILLKSDMKHDLQDNYRVYKDSINIEKIAIKIYYIVKKILCAEETTYFFEKLGVTVKDEAVGGRLEIVTKDTLKFGGKEW